RRAGADDIMTKPFQSIRQLVSRVGSLLGSNQPPAQAPVSESKPPARSESKPPARSESKPPKVSESKLAAKPVPAQPDATVLVEGAPLVTTESHETSASASAPDIDFQTADTAQLDRIEDASGTSTFDAQAFEDTIEVEPQFDHAMNASSGHLAPV